MKTSILKSLLILVLLLAGYKNAQAATSVNDVAIASGTIYSGQTNVPVAGISVQSTNNFTNINITGASFTVNQSPTGIFTGGRLVISSYPFNPSSYTVIATTPTTTSATTITFTGIPAGNATNPTITNTTEYFYLLVDYAGATPATNPYTFAPKQYYNNGTAANVSTPITTNSFTLKAPLLTATADNNGLAATSQTASNSSLAVYGVSLTSNGTSTFTGLTFGTTTTATNINAVFSSVTLYSSTSATWTTSTAPGVTSLSTINNPTGTSLAFTGLPTQTITNGNTLYYFLVANYVEPATSYTLRVNTPTLTGTGGTTLTGTATGQTYTFNAPSVTETAITAGLTNPTTLYSSQNAIPVFGMQVKASGAASFTALTFNASSTISPNYQNVTLYSSSNNTFDGTATAVSGATYTSTTTSVTATLPSTQSLADGTSIYYYLVVDYNEPATTVTQKFTAGTIAGTTVNGTAAAGPTYTLTAPSIAETTVAATGLTNPTTLVLSQTGIPVFGMQVKSTGTSTFTALTFNASSTISPNYQNVTLYSSSNPTFDGSATATGATYTSTATSITATLPAAQTLNNGGTIYYYLVVDYYEPTITTVNQTFTAGTVAGATVTGSNAVGPTYTLTAPSVAETTIAATGLTNPTTLISNATGIPVFGMALKATGNVSFTALTFNASSTISPNYQNVTLYSSSNNTFDGTATAVSGATYTSTATSVTATLPSAQTITNGSTLYYYLVVDYTVPATTVTQTITAGTITGTTVTGSAAVGPTYTLTAPSVALAAITAGLAPTTLYSSQTTLPVFGMSLTATGTPSFTALTFNASSSPISPNFQNVTLYSSSSNTFDGTAAAVSGVTYTNTATSVTATLPSAQTMTNGSVLYYYLVVDYTEPPTTNATQKFTAGTITGSNVTGAAAGQTYTLTAPSVAETTVAATGLTNPTTLYSSQNTIPVFGMQLKSTGTSTFTALKFNFSATIAPNYTGVTLYSSSNATFDGTATAVSGATYTSTTTSVTATLPSAQTLANNATIYYYIVVNYVEPATTTSTQIITASTITGANVPGASAVGPTYTLTAPSLTQAQVTAGLTGTNLPLTLNQTNLAMFGMSLKSTGTSSFTSVSFTATQNIAAYFSGNVTLYSSTSATFPGVGSPSLTLLQAVAVPNSTNIVFNSIPTQTIGNNVTTYYYLVVDGYNPPTTPTTFEWDLSATTPISGGTITTTNVTYGDKTGQPYTLNSATLVQAQDNNGLTGTTLPLTLNQTNLALYGMSLRSTGTSSFTGMNFTATRTINAYFGGNVNLYATTTATWPGVGSATLLSTVPAPGTTNVAFTFPTQTIGNGVTMYYWIVMDSYSPPITSTTFQFNVPNVALTGGTMNATNSTVTYGDQSGQSYTLTAATMVENQVIAGLTATTINGVQNNIALYGMSLKSTGTSSFTTMGFTATRNISTYFTGNISLYSSTSNTWSGTGSATLLQSQVIPNSTGVTFTFPTQTIGSGVTMYYYVVLDANKIPTTSTTFELDLNTTAPLSGGTMNGTNSTVTYNDKTGQQYTLNPAVSLGTASTSGLDPNPLNVSQTGGILGFAVTTYQNLTFTQFNLTASVNVNTYFSNVKLYSSTSNSFASATPVSGTPTISALNSTTLTISGLSQNVNSTTVYYFIVADFTLPATDGTFRLTANSVQTATTTYTNGGPIAGTLYNCGPQSVDWIGGTTGSLTDWNTASNWYQGVVPGPLDDVNIGVNRAYITSTKTNNPIISAAETVTVASITFGSIESQHTVNYKYGTEQLMSLQVDGALTVTGDITQNHSVSAAGIKTNYLITTLKGNGTISCQNFYVGDLTEPANTVADIAQVSIQVFHLTINGNVILNSNGNGVTGTSGNKGICYPWFSLEKGTTTIYGTVNFNKNFFPYEDAFDIYNPSSPGVSEIHWPDYALFTCDNTASSPSTLELLNKNAFPSTGGIQGYHTYFTYGGNNGTVLYDDPNAEQQTIYSSNDLSTNAGSVSQTSNWPAYYNLSFNGTSTKLVNKDNSAGLSTAGLTIAGAWKTDGGQVKLGQNPTITTGSTWTNTAQITHAAGSITVGGMFTNTTLADASGNVACGTGTITFKGGYTNNTTFTPSATGIINFSPTTSETITDNSTNGTIFNIVNFTSGTTTIQPGTSGIGNIGVSAAGVLTMSGSSTLVGGTTTSGGVGYLTLMSNASGTATVYTPTGTKITGNVNVQRWVTGGTGTRGYRLFSSPVNASLSYTGGGNLSLGYLGANGQFASTTYLGAFTEGPGTGFTYNGSTNPIIYLYDETRPTNNTGFTSGKNIGVYSITGNTVTTLTNGVQQAGVNVPVGNSYLLYYVGDNHLTDQTAVTGTRIPESTAVTATGYLNQSNVPVYFWKLNTTTIPYDVNGGNLPGLNQVGNPYPATISLAALYNQNIAAPYNSNISPIFWELDPTSGISGTYISYNALSHTTSTGTGRASSDLIVEGQGFLVQALGSTSTLTFTEAQKVPYASTSGSTLLMSIPTTVAQHDITSQPLAQSVVPAAATNINSQSLAQSVVPAAATNINSQSLAQSDANFNTAASLQSTLNGLHLQLSNGTAYTQTGIYFGSQWSDAYSPYEDAIDLDGTSPKVWLSSYTSDGKRVSINELGDYSNGKKVKLFVGSSASGNFTMSLVDIQNIDTADYNVFLYDRKLNDSVDIRRSKSYNFTINNSDTTTWGANRFVLIIENSISGPYALTSFSGAKVSNGVSLTWTTINAGGHINYVLQRKNANGNYNNIYTTQSNGNNLYNYVDTRPNLGKNIYRLKQTDNNGNVSYSNLLNFDYDFTTPTGSLTIYPNPSSSIINMNLVVTDNTVPANYTAIIYNSSGGIAKKTKVNSNTWTENISSFKLGMYILNITDANGNLVGQSKFIKVE